MNFNESNRSDLFGGGGGFNQGGGGKSKRDEILEQKRRQRGMGGGNQGRVQFDMHGGGGPASGFNNQLDLPMNNYGRAPMTTQSKSSLKQTFGDTSSLNGSFDSPSKKKKKVMFKVPQEEKYRKKFDIDADINDRDNNMGFRSSVRSEVSDDDFTRSSFQQLRLDDPGDTKLTRQNVQNFNQENDYDNVGNFQMSRSQSQPQFNNQNNYDSYQSFNNNTQNFNNNQVETLNLNFHLLKEVIQDQIISLDNPNQKYIPTHNFVNGEGTTEDGKKRNQAPEAQSLQQELLSQIEEKRRKREEEKRKLKDDELKEEERVKREIAELNRRDQMEKDKKKQVLSDIMDKYQAQEIERKSLMSQNMNMINTMGDGGGNSMQNKQYGGPLNETSQMIRIQEQTRPIDVEQPGGAQYAQYKSSEDMDYDYQKDFEKFDVLNRGHRAAFSGVPRAKMISDIGHDLKHSIQNEVDKIRKSIKDQQIDFKDQLDKITTEASLAIEERDRVKNHLELLRSEMRRKREEQMFQENNLIKTLNKYQLEPQRYHYPQRHVHIEHTVPKPEEKKSIYEKLFFDKISNVIEAEKLNPPLKLYREATQNPKAQITIGQDHYFSNSKGALNSESILVTLDNKQLYPSKSLYEMPDLQSKTTIVNWNKEPYEYYNHRVKDLNPRDEMYLVRNNYESKYANKIDDNLNFQRYNLPEREEHKPQYDHRIRPIDLANINVEKIHQVNEQRLTRLEREIGGGSGFNTNQNNGKKSNYDLDMINDILSLKL
ncbi:UNKNOWN [Stylonychia lemnae]|uniref:Uncharacterized protein n=1 Tax=Stylonychia lemnae TaxID=5949 RepID=A0A077ZS26_STYLE|nr:UNKNOWN [Stylonychia lemnae]|eukprot:CDW72165.1 UNKNOWN [Stylonychia lemnae]